MSQIFNFKVISKLLKILILNQHTLSRDFSFKILYPYVCFFPILELNFSNGFFSFFFLMWKEKKEMNRSRSSILKYIKRISLLSRELNFSDGP